MGHQALGVAVIEQAMTDAQRPPFLGKRKVLVGRRLVEQFVVNVDVEQAIEFLTRPSQDLTFWCEVAGVERDPLIAKAAKLFHRKRNSIAQARMAMVEVA